MKTILSNEEVAQVSALIREAGKALMSYWPNSSDLAQSSLQVQIKNDGFPVSEADFASNEILTLGLSKIFPEDCIISEESPYPSPSAKRPPRSWILDPLDGTKSFIAGRDDFSILVALCTNETIEAGFMFFPARGTFVWSVGTGGDPQGLAVSSSPVIRPGHLYVAKIPEFKRPDLKCPHIDSGLAFQKVASGELDGLVIRMETHREWDIAAPAAVLLRAGGTITDETGRPIRFGVSPRPCAYCVASNKLVHSEVLSLIDV